MDNPTAEGAAGGHAGAAPAGSPPAGTGHAGPAPAAGDAPAGATHGAAPALERLGHADLRAVVTAYRDALRAHQEALNRLNVYPVPDGDTGTNMALTLESVVGELDGAEDMAATCKAVSHGSLMGARGNSGVILSQILRGIADTCRGSDAVGPRELADALRAASDAAYGAVMQPVEGTILTVAKGAAADAGEAAAHGKALVDVLDAARNGAADALERTPELLPVLAQAGVVDAGGAGLLLLLDAFLHVAAARPLPEAPPAPAGAAAAVGGPDAATARGEGGGMDGPRYEVMYLLDAPDEAVPRLKKAWAAIGDSIVVVGGDGTWNCHVHTDEIGAAVEAALDAGGRPRHIRVTDLAEQVDEERWVREAAATTEPEPAPQRVSTAVVAVAAGEGLGRIFRSLGVRRIVGGGQSMNPSTAEILEAVEAAPADEVVVLPNNENIVPVAEQVHELTDKTVRVVPTTGIAEGMAALLGYDPNGSAEGNAASMGEAAGQVVSGEVARAVRASSCDAGPIAAGDWLGVAGGRIEVVAPTLVDAATSLLDRLVGDDHEIVTVFEGGGASAAETRRVTEWLCEHRPGVTPEVHQGGQPLYPYVFSIE